MSTAIQDKPGTNIDVRAQRFGAIRDALNKAKCNLQMALPKHMTPDRMLRIALSACSKNPLLMECSPQSIALALINASETGLEPNGRDAHLIPYWNTKADCYEAQFQADYKGLVQLAYRSGQVASFHAAAVYEKDSFDYSFGTDSFVKHRPCDNEDPGPLKYAYAIADLKDGGCKFVVLNRRQVMKRKASSQSASKGFSPWKTHEEAMWAKSAAKELTKWIPLSAEMQRAVQLDELAERGEQQTGMTIDLQLPPPDANGQTASDRMAARLGSDTNATAVDSTMESQTVEVTPTDAPASTDAAPSTSSDPIANLPALLAACTGKLEVRKLYDELCGPESKLSQDAADKAHELCKAREAEIEAGRGGK